VSKTTCEAPVTKIKQIEQFTAFRAFHQIPYRRVQETTTRAQRALEKLKTLIRWSKTGFIMQTSSQNQEPQITLNQIRPRRLRRAGTDKTRLMTTTGGRRLCETRSSGSVNKTKHNQCSDSKSGEENQLARLGRELLVGSKNRRKSKQLDREQSQAVVKARGWEQYLARACHMKLCHAPRHTTRRINRETAPGRAAAHGREN
jgi:hypothetical protein